MLKRIGQLAIFIGLASFLMLGMVLVASSYHGIGNASNAGTGGMPLPAGNSAVIPSAVVDDATDMARTLFGDSREEVDNFVNQVLAIYDEARDKDFILLFNSGGWGWNLLEDSQGWDSIFTGITTELTDMGYQALLLDYKRTPKSWRACFEEATEIANFYPSKAKDLAARVELLTRHLPQIKVILAGESTGTVITDKVMTIMKDNPNVYTIQTGPPFWHKTAKMERTLVLKSNGIVPDSFSEGDFLHIITANLKDVFRFPDTDQDFGNIFKILKAPGHDYWWQHPSVYTEITDFLNRNFSLTWP